jgi:FkbM family methyltransferase
MALSSTVRWFWEHPDNRGRHLRGLGRIISFQVRARTNGGEPVIVPIGQRSQVHAVRGMSASTKVLYGNPPDPGSMGVWQRALAPGDLFVDVGANVGTYSLIAGESGAELVAVEPNERARGWLQRNLALNGLEAEVLDVAIGAEPGTATFTSGKDTTNSFDPEGDQVVVVDTLDRIIGERRAHVKVDVEGFELEVLAGAAAALGSHRIELIQMEMNEDRDAICTHLRDLGYELFEATLDGELVPYDGALDLFAKPAATDASS